MNKIKIKLLQCFAFASTATLVGCGGVDTKATPSAIDPSEPVSSWKMVWNDEFNSDVIDPTKWEHEVNCDGGGNNEKQCYTDSPENSYVSNGSLNIVALPAAEGAEQPYTSARLRTKAKGDWKYGRIEARIKMPSGQGSWPAFWMLPTDNVYGGWPHSGEIDIVEALNLKTEDDEGNVESSIHGTLHYGEAWPNNSHSGKEYSFSNGINPADEFKTYAIEWQEGEIRWYVDGYLYQVQQKSIADYNSDGIYTGTLSHQGWFANYIDRMTGEYTNYWDNAPFDQEFHLLLNFAVGGDWPENVNNLGVDADAFANGQTMQITYVRVYQCDVGNDDGSGCETIRPSYLDDDTLVPGKAPNPPAPSTGWLPDLTVFNSVDTQFAAGHWAASGDVAIEDVDAGGDYGAVKQFTFNTEEAVAYFQSDDTTDVSGYSHIEFDMLVVSDNGADNLFMKMDCVHPCSSGDYELDKPTEGVWTSYRIALADLVANEGSSLDLSKVNTPLVFNPTWGNQSGFVAQVDNVRFTQDKSLDVFVDEDTSFGASHWAASGDVAIEDVVTGDDHGAVKQFTFNTDEAVAYFQSEETVDVTAYTHIDFDMLVIADNGAPDLFMKMDCVHPCSSGDYSLDKPAEGVWTSFSIPLTDLLENEGSTLDLTKVNTPLVFNPTWGNQNGFVAQIDNVRFTADIDVFVNKDTEFMANHWAASGEVAIEELELGGEHGAVKQFTFNTDEAVAYFQSEDTSDVSGYNTINFDVLIVNDNGAADFFMKMDCVHPCSSGDFPLEKPTEGVWTSYTIKLTDLVANEGSSLDLTKVNTPLVFNPTWGNQNGFVVQIDNVQFK